MGICGHIVRRLLWTQCIIAPAVRQQGGVQCREQPEQTGSEKLPRQWTEEVPCILQHDQGQRPQFRRSALRMLSVQKAEGRAGALILPGLALLLLKSEDRFADKSL